MESIRPTYLGGLTLFLTVVNIACVVLPYWIHIKGETDIGVFASIRVDSSALVSTKCDDTMSEIECGYLKSMQISSVLTILFGFFAAMIYYMPPRSFAALPTFLAVSGTCGHCTFSIITEVLFVYFKRNYFDDDGINREGDSPNESDVSWQFVFWLWTATVIVSFIMVVGAYRCIYKARNADKGLL
jgi:hypothetical protein